MNIKSFDYYEFAGVVVPGATTVGFIMLINLPSSPFFSVGGLFFLIIFSYGIGQLQQELAKYILPQRAKFIISDNNKREKLLKALLNSKLLSEENFQPVYDTNHALSGEIFENLITWTKIKNKDDSRFEVFNAVEGTSRGLAVSSIIILIVGVVTFFSSANIELTSYFALLAVCGISYVCFRHRAERYLDKNRKQVISEFLMQDAKA